MTNKERVELARLLIGSVAEGVQARESAKKKNNTTHLTGGYNIPMKYTTRAISREITLLRQTLLEIEENL